MDAAEVPTRWYLRLEVADKPGVLARIATAFADAGVSIRSVWQEGRGDEATLLIVTHEALEKQPARRRRRPAATSTWWRRWPPPSASRARRNEHPGGLIARPTATACR